MSVEVGGDGALRAGDGGGGDTAVFVGDDADQKEAEDGSGGDGNCGVHNLIDACVSEKGVYLEQISSAVLGIESGPRLQMRGTLF